MFQVRLVSQEVLFTHNDNISVDSTLSHLLVDWGQWIDHDLVLTPQSPSTAAFKTGADCTHTCNRDSPCFPIQVHFTSSLGRLYVVFFIIFLHMLNAKPVTCTVSVYLLYIRLSLTISTKHRFGNTVNGLNRKYKPGNTLSLHPIIRFLIGCCT